MLCGISDPNILNHYLPSIAQFPLTNTALCYLQHSFNIKLNQPQKGVGRLPQLRHPKVVQARLGTVFRTRLIHPPFLTSPSRTTQGPVKTPHSSVMSKDSRDPRPKTNGRMDHTRAKDGYKKKHAALHSPPQTSHCPRWHLSKGVNPVMDWWNCKSCNERIVDYSVTRDKIRWYDVPPCRATRHYAKQAEQLQQWEPSGSMPPLCCHPNKIDKKVSDQTIQGIEKESRVERPRFGASALTRANVETRSTTPTSTALAPSMMPPIEPTQPATAPHVDAEMDHRLEAAPEPEYVVLEHHALVQHREAVLHLRNRFYQLSQEIQSYNYAHRVQNLTDLQMMLNQFIEYDRRTYQTYDRSFQQ